MSALDENQNDRLASMEKAHTPLQESLFVSVRANTKDEGIPIDVKRAREANEPSERASKQAS